MGNSSSMTGLNIFNIEEFYVLQKLVLVQGTNDDVEINHTIVTRGSNCAATAAFICGIDCKGGVSVCCSYFQTGIGGTTEREQRMVRNLWDELSRWVERPDQPFKAFKTIHYWFLQFCCWKRVLDKTTPSLWAVNNEGKHFAFFCKSPFLKLRLPRSRLRREERE